MAPLAILQVTPLVTACVWLGLAAYLVVRDRFRTWTEAFLLATCVSLGGYALSDFAFLNAASASGAETLARASFTWLTLSSTSFFLFAAVLHGRIRRRLALVALPAAGALVLVWARLVVGAGSAADVGLPYRAVCDPWPLALWLGYALGCGVLGLGSLGKTFAEVWHTAPALGRRMRLELAAVVFALALGAGSNLLVSLFAFHLPPLLSTVLVVPGLAAVTALSPKSETPFLEAAHRWKSSGYRLKAAFLTYADGTLLGAEVPPGALAVESALFASTLDVIQNFMRTSFPLLEGKWLRSITQGDYTLILERGQATCLTVALEGEANDQLRRLMREALREYERANQDVLRRWRGEPADATGTKEMLSAVLQG